MPVWTERPHPLPSRSAARARVLALPRFSDRDRRLARRLPRCLSTVAQGTLSRVEGCGTRCGTATGGPPARLAGKNWAKALVAVQDRPRPAPQARSGVQPLRARPTSRRRETVRGDSRVLDVTDDGFPACGVRLGRGCACAAPHGSRVTRYPGAASTGGITHGNVRRARKRGAPPAFLASASGKAPRQEYGQRGAFRGDKQINKTGAGTLGSESHASEAGATFTRSSSSPVASSIHNAVPETGT